MAYSVAIDPHKLLKIAGELAGQRAGRGRPSQSGLRRSISTSYYALFMRSPAKPPSTCSRMADQSNSCASRVHSGIET
jgi:hypothetical protein